MEPMNITTKIVLDKYSPTFEYAKIVELKGELEDFNSPEQPRKIFPTEKKWQHNIKNGETKYIFPPYSFTIIIFE